MQSACWTVCEHQAVLESSEFSAKVNRLRPSAGVHEVSAQGQYFDGLRILQLRAPSHGDRDEHLVESYVRGPDLVATYGQTDQRTVRPQIYWRAASLTHEGYRAVGIDMEVSMQTSLLDSTPSVKTVSQLGQSEVWRLSCSSSGTFERLRVSTSHPSEFQASNGTSLFLFRLQDSESSYVEMVHPSDFDRAVLSRNRNDRGSWTLAFKLFDDEHLEKGVIRRGRIRGMFVPRQHDQQIAVACYRQLSDSAPPLTT